MGKCYIPTELDKRLAQSDPFLGSPESTSKYFAWMRGLYDETYGDQNWESMEDSDIKAIITKFEGQQKQKEAKEIKAAGTNIASFPFVTVSGFPPTDVQTMAFPARIASNKAIE